MNSMQPLQDSVRYLSYGTMATLTGLRLYDDLYSVKRAFTVYCEALSAKLSWVEAWQQFELEQREEGVSWEELIHELH